MAEHAVGQAGSKGRPAGRGGPAPPGKSPRPDNPAPQPGDEGRFHDPNVAINRVYTRTGDAGETGLVGGLRVPKDDRRIEAYGDVDELNAVVGLCRAALDEAADRAPSAGRTQLASLAHTLLRVQHQLFNLGSELASAGPLPDGQPRIRDADIDELERAMDEGTALLPTLRSFVLPGGGPGAGRLNACLHLARTVCRRAERRTVTLHRAGGCDARCVRYLNRLSDAFFVWSRRASHLLGDGETLWDPNVGR